MKRRLSYPSRIALLFFFLLTGMTAWWMYRKVQQHRKEDILIAAIKSRNTEMALAVMECGPLYSDMLGQPLLYANAEETTFLLEHGADIEATNAEGNTVLMYAVAQGSYDKVRILLEHGATTGTKDADGKTALNIARDNIEYATHSEHSDAYPNAPEIEALLREFGAK